MVAPRRGGRGGEARHGLGEGSAPGENASAIAGNAVWQGCWQQAPPCGADLSSCAGQCAGPFDAGPASTDVSMWCGWAAISTPAQAPSAAIVAIDDTKQIAMTTETSFRADDRHACGLRCTTEPLLPARAPFATGRTRKAVCADEDGGTEARRPQSGRDWGRMYLRFRGANPMLAHAEVWCVLTRCQRSARTSGIAVHSIGIPSSDGDFSSDCLDHRCRRRQVSGG